MRSASICVFPDPAPASTSRFVCRFSRIARRDCSSNNGFMLAVRLDMRRELSKRFQLRIRELRFRLLLDVATARGLVVAPLARLLVGGMNEGTVENQRAQVTEHSRRLRERRRRNLLPLATAFVTR